jgi:hypothetical protein
MFTSDEPKDANPSSRALQSGLVELCAQTTELVAQRSERIKNEEGERQKNRDRQERRCRGRRCSQNALGLFRDDGEV